MKRNIIAAATFFAAGVLVAPSAHAQCPAIPLSTLVGTWAFSAEGFQFPPTLFLGSGGRFVASITAAGVGVLTITQTASIDGNIVRQEVDAGRFQISDDCTRGTLTFNVSSRPIQFDFFFVNANEIVMVGSNSRDIVTGEATRVAAVACPADPLLSLSGTWVFSTEGFTFPPTRFLGSAGRFVATINATTGAGVLSITQSTSVDGGPTRLETDAGRFQVDPGCAGGTLTFNTSSRPVQFDFFFVNANEILLVGSNNGDIVTGEARRFGT
jgi:hypothetical protein